MRALWSGFTPSSSNLVAVTSDPHPTISGLTPGTTYYVKSISADERGNVSAPSGQVTFKAGQLTALHFDPELSLLTSIPNGSFESYYKGSDQIPDHREMVTGSYGFKGDAYRSTDPKEVPTE